MSIKSKIVLNGLKKDLPSVKIIEPYTPDIIECEGSDDFSAIINADPDKYNAMSTQKLNKLFRIPDYKVTKIKGEICLRAIRDCERQGAHTTLTTLQTEINNIKHAFNELSEQFDIIKDMLVGEGHNTH
jgi:DNA gyrase/topoisomerase IV subunit A